MRRIRLLLIAIIFILPGNLCFSLEGLKINFIDVGYGEAILVQTNRSNVLIDTGTLLTGYKVVGHLKENKVKKINYLIITHPDLDHLSGAFFIVPEFKIDKLFDNGQGLDEENDIYRWYKELVRSKENYSVLKTGDILKIDDIYLEVLWPDRPNIADSFNANSLVLMLKYKNFKCLLTGDLNDVSERQLLKKGFDLKADVLKIAHHGYLDATSEEFLNAVSARYAIISTGKESTRIAPSERVIDLLNKKHIKTYRTDEDGNVVISVRKEGKFDITTER